MNALTDPKHELCLSMLLTVALRKLGGRLDVTAADILALPPGGLLVETDVRPDGTPVWVARIVSRAEGLAAVAETQPPRGTA